MRQIIILLSLSLSIGCATTKKTKTVSNYLNGVWKPIKHEMAGKALPDNTFENYRLILTDTLYSYGTYNSDKGVTTYKDGKMDIYGKEGVNTGKHFTAIYKLEKEMLTICYNLSGDRYPVTFETKGEPMFFLSVFQKVLPKN